MIKHLKEKTNWKSTRGKRDEEHMILGYAARNPNPYTSSMESVRVVVVTNNLKKEEGPIALDMRNWVESERYTGPSKAGGLRLERHQLIEFLSILPEIKEALEITDEEIQEEIAEREEALSGSKEEE